MILLIDVSRFSGPHVDFEAFARAGVRGCYVEAQRGNDSPNPYFAEQVAAVRDAGMAAGATLFTYPLNDASGHTDRDPSGQVGLFYDACAGLGEEAGDLPPMLDNEWPEPPTWSEWGVTPASMAAWYAGAVDQTVQRFRRKPLFYTDAGFWRPLGGAVVQPCFAELPLMLASYPVGGVLTAPPTMSVAPPPPWKAATVWQFSGANGHGSGFTVPGGSLVDGSVFLGDEQDWQRFLAK